MEFHIHGLHWPIASITQMLIGMGNCQLLHRNGTLYSVETQSDNSYRVGQNFYERSMQILWPAIEHSVRLEL